MRQDESKDGTKTRPYTIYICNDCYELNGDMCHNPDCVFIRKTTKEIGEIMDDLLIRPVINGVRYKLGVKEHTKQYQFCWVCLGVLSKEFKPEFCCDGRDCGCQGGPVDPVVCSKECEDIFMARARSSLDLRTIKDIATFPKYSKCPECGGESLYDRLEIRQDRRTILLYQCMDSDCETEHDIKLNGIEDIPSGRGS